MEADTRIAAFLNDIGASQLSARPSESIPIFAKHRARLDEEIQAVQLRIHHCLQDNRSALEKQRHATASLTSRLQSIQRDLREVDEQLHSPQNGLKPALVTALQQHAQLQRDTLAKQTTVAALLVLQAQAKHLSNLEELQQAGKLDEAVEVLLQAEMELENAAGWMHATAAWKQSHARLVDYRFQTEERLRHLVFEVALVVSAKQEPNFSLNVQPTVQSGSVSLPLGALLRALHMLGLLDKPLSRLLKDFLLRMIQPVVLDSNQSIEMQVSTIHLQSTGHSTSLFASLLVLMRRLSKLLLPALPPDLKTRIRTLLVDPMLQLLVDRVLLPALPDSLDLELLKQYDLLIKDAKSFESELRKEGFDFAPILLDWTSHVDRHWTQKVNERVVKMIKALVVKAQWETIVVDSRPAPRAKRRTPRSRQQTPGSPEVLNAAATSVTAVASPPRDDGWSFDSTPASPVVVQTAPSPSVPSAEPIVEAADDAWGFNEEEKPAAAVTSAAAASATAPASSVAKVNGADDAAEDSWGFDDEEADASPAPAPVPAAQIPPPASIAAEEDGADAWGFDAANESVQAESRPSHDRQDSLADWSWEQEAEPQPAQISPSASERKSSRNRLGAQKVNGIAHKPDAKKAVEIASPSAPPAKVEKYTISTSTKQVLGVSTSLLADAKKLHEANFPHAAFARAADSVQHSCSDVLDYFRATMAVQHAQLLDSVPALGMQFANDCDWLAREIADLDLGSSTDMAFLAMAKSVRDAQLAAQKAILSDSLDEAGHFRNTAEPTRFAACQRAMRQITHTLERLSQVWKPPSLTYGHYGSIMGKLVNGVLARVLAEIEDQDDISETDSQRLNELCKMLHGLEALFVENGNSSVALHVPLWFKFVFLSELLEASLVDIMFLFEEGHLVDFSSDELVKLIRALFSESPNRTKAIDTIRGRRSAQ